MAETKNQVPDYLGMSDEEILNMPAPVAVQLEEERDDEEKDAQASEEVSQEATAASEDADDAGGDEPTESDADEGDDDDAPETKTPKALEGNDLPEQPPETGIDYKAEYERLLAPFRANGREIKVNSVNDAISLMQMGANYNKKMAALKPNLRLMKMLENNNLLSEEKISFLIDLEKKRPEAINKLVKDSGIDPMDLDAEKASEYKRTTYTVDDREIELDTVLDELKDSPTYNQTLDVVGNKWDAASKQVIVGTPQLLKVINDHLQSGIYDLISKEIDNERLFGRLDGLSDIQAYRRVGDALHARGAFNHLSRSSAPAQEKQPVRGAVIPPKPRQVDEDKRKDKKRAASSTTPGIPNPQSEDFNPLAMSDDEFAKLVNKQFT